MGRLLLSISKGSGELDHLQPTFVTYVADTLYIISLSQFWQMKTLAKQSFQISQDYFPET